LNENEKHPSRRAIAFGIALWVVFAIIAIGIRGVRWDETFEHAQVLTGQTPYPEGHPLFRYVREAFSIQTHLSAVLLRATSSATVVCGFRNVLYLLTTALPAFLLTTLVARKAIWGHVAALLTLQHVLIEFDGSYPLAAWPTVYSNGAIGGGYALLVLYCFAAGRLGAAFFLTGLMPCVHIGQMPPVIGLAVCVVCWTWRCGDRTTMRRAVLFGVLGVAVSAAFWLFTRALAVPPPQQGPYFSTEAAGPIWAGYTRYYDQHRHLLPGNGVVGLLGAVLLAGAAAAQTGRDLNRAGPLTWYFVYALLVTVAVFGSFALSKLFGAALPFALVAWMPYRLINHVPTILLAVIIGLLTRRFGGSSELPRASLLLVGALVFGTLGPGLVRLVGREAYARYLTPEACVLFVLYGAAVAALCLHLRQERQSIVSLCVPAFVAVCCLAMYHQFGAFCAALGGTLALGLHCVPASPAPTPRARGRTLGTAALCALVALALVHREFTARRHLPVEPFLQRVREYLDARKAQDAMLIGPPNSMLIQAKTNRPVLAESATPSLISYVPALAPSIQKIFGQLYGVRFDTEPGDRGRPWQTVWAERTKEQWRALGTEYDCAYVIADDSLVLDLAPVLREGRQTLYKLPGADAD